MSDAERIVALEARVAELEAVLHVQPRTVYMQDKVKWRIVKDLPGLMLKYPSGVTADHIAEFYGASKATTVIVLSALAKRGRLQWIFRRGCRTKVAVTNGAPLPIAPLTQQQQRVMNAIMAREGRLSVSIREFAFELGARTSTIDYVVRMLKARGELTQISGGRPGHPRIYHVNKRISEADIWRASLDRPNGRPPINVDHLMGQTASSTGYDA